MLIADTEVWSAKFATARWRVASADESVGLDVGIEKYLRAEANR